MDRRARARLAPGERLSRRWVAVKRTHSDMSIVSFSHHGRGLEANAPAEAPGSPSPRRGASLRSALARDAEFLGQLHERDLFLGEPAHLEDAPLALVEHGERTAQRLAAVIELLARGERRLLVRDSSTSRSCHSPESPSSRIAALSEASPLSRRFM